MESTEPRKINMIELQQIRRLKEEGRSIVFVNGCFDLFHVGHLSLLEFAKTQGDILVVGINSDKSIKITKGTVDNVSRPIINEDSRFQIVKALKCVDFAILFDESSPGKLIEIIRPEIIVKGSDYMHMEVLEKKYINECGSKVVFYERIASESTTRIINTIKRRIGL